MALLLALLLALTGESMAVARGMPDAAGEIVLCTTKGAVTVPVDENGQPTGKPHVCPDLAMTLFAAAAALPDLPAGPPNRGERLAVAAALPGVSAGNVRAVARGPPGRG